MRGIVFHIPADTAVTPIEGHAFVNRWWTVHPEKGVAFYCTRRRGFDLEPGVADEPSPQCNSDEYSCRRIQQSLYPDCETKFLPVVFVGHAIKEMHRLRKELAQAKIAP